MHAEGKRLTAMAVQGTADINGDGIGGSGQFNSSYGGKGSVGTCVITGGSVRVSTMGPTVYHDDAKTVPVYLTAVTLDGVTAETAVSVLTTDASYPYGVNGMKTGSDGKLYLYLPDGKSALAAETASVCYTGKITESSSASASGTLDPGDFTVTGSGYTYPNHVLTVTKSGSYTVSMTSSGTTTSTDSISVASGVTASITLSNVSIDASDWDGCAFGLLGSAEVKITLIGDNTLKSSGTHAGLQVPAGSKLTVDGAGTLYAEKIYRDQSNQYSAGIGGGGSGSETCGSVTITSGTVTATSTYGGAGIGGGQYGDGGIVYISGRSVKATGGSGAEAIGAGKSGTNSGTLKNNSIDNADVYLTTVTLADASGTAVAGSLISSLTASLSSANYDVSAGDDTNILSYNDALDISNYSKSVVRMFDERTFLAAINICPSPTFFSWVLEFKGLIKIKGPESVVQEYNLKKALEALVYHKSHRWQADTIQRHQPCIPLSASEGRHTAASMRA